MALLMRRLFVDAQAKLRRMVEEHSANITSRIDSDYPSTIPAPLPSSTCTSQNPKFIDSTNLSPISQLSDINLIKNSIDVTENINSDNACDLDVKCISDKKKENFKSSRPSSVDSKKIKSNNNNIITNTPSSITTTTTTSITTSSSLDISTNDDVKQKKELKKTKCNSLKCEGPNLDNLISDSQDPEMSYDDNNIKNTSSPENQKPDSPKPGCSNQTEIDSSSSRSLQSSDGNRDELAALLPSSPSNYSKSTSAMRRLKLENERLQAEVTRLRRLVVSGASSILKEKKSPIENGDNSIKMNALEMELQLFKEALITLKSDRRRLKAEKFDLLNQMKQLYATLEDKEKELRDFIRNYEQRVRENDTSLQQLSTEREERERERWSLLRHARDEAERSLSLAAQLNAKELQLQQTQEQLQDARRQLTSSGCLSDQESLASLPRHSVNGGALTPSSGGLLSGHGLGLLPGDRGSCSADSGVRVNSDRESGATSVAGNLSDSTTEGTPTIMVEGNNLEVDSISLVSSVPPPHMYQTISAKDCSPTLSPLNANNFSRSIDTGILSRSVEQLSSPLDPEPNNFGRRLKHPHGRPTSGRGGTWGSISRVFARSRHRNKANSLQETSDHSFDSYRSWSPLTEEGYAEKLRLLREASSIPMERWRAPTVLAWLEIALGMPQYGARCAENIKSGKIGPLHGQVLLELSDMELECGMGISHPMHRKKLRLAIEEHRQPALVRYPCIAQLGHTWVSSEWLPDLGLSQYSDSFTANMVDARMLEHLSKKELEKYLSVTRKFHQASIVHGIHLLRIMKYDRQALAVRRHQCENMDADPLVWTNQRFIRWARSIDLGEYADNLKDSGVHGGLVVLEPSFNGDTMATALGIPASKNIIRRHLTAELEALVLPARSTLEHYVRVRTKSRVLGGSLGRSFSRSCAGLAGNTHINKETINVDSRRASLRGSLSRAFGLTKSKSERERDKPSPTSSSGSSSVISRVSPPLQYSIKSRSGGESPVYATPFTNNYHSQTPIYHRRSDEYNYYLNQSIDEYDLDKCESLSKNVKAKLFSGSLQRNRKRHRRVRSIGDIDVVHLAPV